MESFHHMVEVKSSSTLLTPLLKDLSITSSTEIRKVHLGIWEIQRNKNRKFNQDISDEETSEVISSTLNFKACDPDRI